MRSYFFEIVPDTLRLVRKWHVRQVPYSIGRALRVRIEASEQSVEVAGRRTGLGDKFERLARCLVGAEAVDQHLCDLAARDDPVAGIAGVPPVALQKDEPVLVRSVVVEPAGTHDRVRQPLARSSRYPRRFHFSRSREEPPVPVTPMELISATRTCWPSSAWSSVGTARRSRRPRSPRTRTSPRG